MGSQGKYIDMTGWNMWEHGQPRSVLTVLSRDIEFDKQRKGKPIRWICKCNRCGNIKSIAGIELRRADKPTLSCGCMFQERISHFGKVTFHDITDQEFGFLVAKRKVGKNQYGYALWECECECGVITTVASRELLSGETRSCGCKKSLGEARVAKYLQEHGIEFQREYTFSDLSSERGWKLRFDFAVFQDGRLFCLIEFQGKQHYEPIDGFGGEKAFEISQQNDRAKEEYCKKNGIELYAISYKEDLEQRLEEIFGGIENGSR